MELNQIIDYAIYGVFGVLVLFGLIAGFSRGIRRQLIRTVTVGAALVISFAAVVILKDNLLAYCEEQTVGSLLAAVGIATEEGAWYAGIGGETLAAVSALPLGLIGLPVGFVVLFILISAILLIVHKIICGIVGFTRRSNNFFTRILGMVIGAAQGAAVAMAILLPVTGVAGAFSKTVSYVEEKYPDKANTVMLSDMYNDFVSPAVNNPLFALSSNISAPLYTSMATFTLSGEKVIVTECIESGAVIFVNAGDLLSTDFAYLNQKDKDAINAIKDEITENSYMSSLAAGLLQSVGEISKANGGVSTFEEPIGSFMNSFIDILATSDKECIDEDLNTTLKLLYMLSDEGALSTATEGGDILSCFLKKDAEGKTLLGRVSKTLDENVRMRSLSAAINELAFTMLLENNGSDLVSAEVAESVKTGINSTLAINREDYETPEEHRAAVTDSIKATLDENDISLNDEQLSQMTDYVINDMEGKTEVTDSDIAEFMIKYYEVYKGEDEALPLP